MQKLPHSQPPAVQPVPSGATTQSPDEPGNGTEPSTLTNGVARPAPVDLKHFIQQLAVMPRHVVRLGTAKS